MSLYNYNCRSIVFSIYQRITLYSFYVSLFSTFLSLSFCLSFPFCFLFSSLCLCLLRSFVFLSLHLLIASLSLISSLSQYLCICLPLPFSPSLSFASDSCRSIVHPHRAQSHVGEAIVKSSHDSGQLNRLRQFPFLKLISLNFEECVGTGTKVCVGLRDSNYLYEGAVSNTFMAPSRSAAHNFRAWYLHCLFLFSHLSEMGCCSQSPIT